MPEAAIAHLALRKLAHLGEIEDRSLERSEDEWRTNRTYRAASESSVTRLHTDQALASVLSVAMSTLI
jgi:hypothetical protein